LPALLCGLFCACMGCAHGASTSPLKGGPADPENDSTLLAALLDKEAVSRLISEQEAEMARKRALAQLRHLFNGVDAQKDGKMGVVALTASLEHDDATLALLREAGVHDSFYLVNQLCNADTGSLTWEQFLMYLDKAIASETVGNRTLNQLKVTFCGLPMGRKGRVCTKRIAKALRRDTEEITDLADALEQAGFCPYLTLLEHLDREPCRVTWQEFVEKHVCGLTMPSTPQERERSLRSDTTSSSSHPSGRSAFQASSFLPSETTSDDEAVVVREWQVRQEPQCWEVCCAASAPKLHPLAI